MTRPTRSFLAAALAVGFVLVLPDLGRAQLGGSTDPSLARSLRRAAPSATFVTEGDGRLRAAWGLGLTFAGVPAPEAQGRAFWAAHAGELGLRAGDLVLERAVRAHGFTILRYRREVSGAAVRGGAGVLVFDPDGRLASVRAAGASGRSAPAPRLTAADAAALARSRFGALRVLAIDEVRVPLGDLLAPAFRVDLGGQLHERVRVWLDARDGTIWAAVDPQRHQRGRVYASDPTSDPVPVEVDLPFLTSLERLTGRYARVETCEPDDGDCTGLQRAVADEGGDFLYDPDEPSFEDPFAEVMAYYHLNVVMAYFRDTHDFAWACDDDALLRAFVNFTPQEGVLFPNAAYSPTNGAECGFLLFGQGTRDFAYDEDVVYHEYGHAVVDQTSELEAFLVDDLGASFEPGALNEAIADYFATTVAGDPRMAEYFEGASTEGGEGSLRNLDNDLRCPDDLVGQSHIDGRILGGLAWDVREALGAERADALIFLAQASLEPTASLSDAAEAIRATAAALVVDGRLTEADEEAVGAAIEARGLDGCRRVVPLEDGDTRRGYAGIPNVTLFQAAGIAPVGYEVRVPAGASSVTLTVSPATRPIRIYLRRGEPVAVDGGVPVADAVVRPDFSGELVLDADADLPLVPCESLFVAVALEDLAANGTAFYEISAAVEVSDPGAVCAAPDAGAAAPPDGGVPGADAGPGREGSGCGCRAAGASRSGAPWGSAGLLGLALLAVARRRRSR
ncbi:MAG: MYXO-CTERM sorting domain-containing protein [Sandaracinaceae bacterium]